MKIENFFFESFLLEKDGQGLSYVVALSKFDIITFYQGISEFVSLIFYGVKDRQYWMYCLEKSGKYQQFCYWYYKVYIALDTSKSDKIIGIRYVSAAIQNFGFGNL